MRGDNGEAVLIDAGPEFRIQALRARIKRIDALLITHPHADHVHGIDDLRIFTHERDLPVYANASTLQELRERFAYVFKPTQEGGGKPHIELREAVQEIVIGSIKVEPIPAMHGALPILGWRCGDTAYLTDCNEIPESSLARLQGVRNLVIDALRERSHSTHYSFNEALAVIERIGPAFAWFTHICHDFSHCGIERWVEEHAPAWSGLKASGKKIEPAHDGLRIPVRQEPNG